ncbi:MAG: limonene,2-epoxide hydrolase [Pseudomonadota bacterium]|jgi:limonene-1,2-epoxide hydrolase
MSHTETIREYYAAWVRDDVTAVMALCTDDVVAGIMPGKDLVGKHAVVQFLDKFAKGMTNKRYDIHAIVVEGDVGMLEGVENYVKEDKPISLPFMTVFRFRDGKVCSWRDYFDMATLMKQLQP